MGILQFMSREQVVEKYSIPPELEQEIFAMLKPVMGTGANTKYLESRVDQQLEEWYANKDRPALAAAKSYLNEEDNRMIDTAGTMEPMERIAYGIERLIEVLVPKTSELVGTEYVASQLGVSKQWVGKMAEKGTIPKGCIAPKVSGGRIWKFYRDKIDAWLLEQ